jgi:D-glycero-alpha-D-manno-heptose 1-phosphate guanylyltransferase
LNLASKQLKVLVLAGGFGSRLKTAVSDFPKSLAPIGDQPFLQLQVENWIKQGATEFAFLLHHQADKVIAFVELQKSSLFKTCRIETLVETQPMGTGGAIANAIEKLGLKEGFMVANADTWLGTGICEVSRAVSPAMAVVTVADASRYGRVEIDEHSHVQLFAEKNSNYDSGLINAGLYRLSPDLFSKWDGKPFSLERDLLPDLVQSHNLTAVRLATDFIDIGIPRDYYRFCNWIRSGRGMSL